MLNTKLLQNSCYWLAILLPISITLGRGVADANLTLVIILFTLTLLFKKNFAFLKEKWFQAILVLWCYLILRSVFSEHYGMALKKVLPFIRFPLFALCMQHLVSKYEKANKHFLLSISIALGFLVIDGYIQFFTGTDLFGRTTAPEAGGYYRLTGPFSKKVLGATITTLSMPVIALLISRISDRKNILLYTAICLLIYTIVILSNERSAAVQITLGMAAIITIFSSHNKKALIVAPVLAATLIVTLYHSNLHDVIQRQIFSIIETAKNYSDSPYGKLWNTGMTLGIKNWVFGIGPMHFEMHCNAISDFCRYHPHNIYIEFFAETGLLGLSLFIYSILKISKEFWVSYKDVHIQNAKALMLGCAIVIALRLLPIPSSGFFKNWYAVPLWMMIGWMLSLSRINKSHPYKG